jgi:hypothetical protein
MILPEVRIATVTVLHLWYGIMMIKMKLRFILIYMVVHLLGLELFSWFLNFRSCAKDPALMHPQLVWDLFLSAFFYFGLCMGWLILFQKHHFRIRELFILQGLVGILLEQYGKVIDLIIKNPIMGIIAAIYIFFVYGAAAGLSGYLYVKSGGTLGVAKSNFLQWRKYIPALVILVIGMVLSMVAFAWIDTAIPLNLTPDKYPICERPFI